MPHAADAPAFLSNLITFSAFKKKESLSPFIKVSPKFSQTLFFGPDVHQREEGASRSPSQPPHHPPTARPGCAKYGEMTLPRETMGGHAFKVAFFKCTQFSGGGTHLDLFPGQSHPPFKWPHPGRPCCPGLEGDDGLQVGLIGTAFQRRNCHTQHIDTFFFSREREAISFCEASVSRR